jgi:hypothetical protein
MYHAQDPALTAVAAASAAPVDVEPTPHNFIVSETVAPQAAELQSIETNRCAVPDGDDGGDASAAIVPAAAVVPAAAFVSAAAVVPAAPEEEQAADSGSECGDGMGGGWDGYPAEAAGDRAQPLAVRARDRKADEEAVTAYI